LRLKGTNSTFANISGMTETGFKGGVFYIESSAGVTFDLTQCLFSNIENAGDGGVIYTNTGSSFTLTSCTFEQCSSGGSGGAIYINSTGIFTFNYCKFLNNSANSGGNDISHNTDVSNSYTSDNFVQTCSISDTPRVGFPGSITLDNLLLGMYFGYK
jgi:hypothetical protein